MDLKKADYFAIVQFGDVNLLQYKMQIQNEDIDHVKNILDSQNVSLFQKSLSFRKFDIALYLLENGVSINHISNDHCNELHYIVTNLNYKESINIAIQLVNKGVDINLKDKKYGNTPFWYITIEAIKNKNKRVIDLFLICLKKKPDIYTENKAGFSIRRLIEERGSIELKKAMEGM